MITGCSLKPDEVIENPTADNPSKTAINDPKTSQQEKSAWTVKSIIAISAIIH
jgi:hypothetical protein